MFGVSFFLFLERPRINAEEGDAAETLASNQHRTNQQVA